MSTTKKDRFAIRREKVVSKLRTLGVDGFVVSDPVNVSYLTGFRGDSSSLVLTPKKSLLVSDARFDEQIEEECPGLDAAIRQPGTTPIQYLADTLTKWKVGKLGFESSYVTVYDLEVLRQKAANSEWVAKTGVVEGLRAIKDSDEIRQIREAIGFAEKAFEMFRACMRPTDTEKELADAMEGYLRRTGARTCAFPSIIAVGPKAAHAHAIPGNTRIEEDDFVLVDWGAKGDFYHSDLTRVLVTRKISAKLREIFEIVLRAQMLAIKGIKPGATGGQIDKIARDVIADAGYGKEFGHGLGHGLGMKVHESPSLAKSREDVLQPGMVVTVEPGIYIKGWGGVRIEDDVLVTKTGCEVLTNLPKDLEQLSVA